MANFETILNIITTVEFSIFGISVTIFTVLYSFIVNKKENLAQHTNSKRTQKKPANPVLDGKVKYIHEYIGKIKQFNRHLLILIFSSFMLGGISAVFIIFKCTIILYLVLILILLSALSLIYIFILLAFVVRHYLKEIKI
jgi:hypothetical protein